VVDVTIFADAHNLNLRSLLGSLHTVNLCHCNNVLDVSALGEVYDFNLFYCNRIVDVSALGGVNTLNESYLLQESS
jgi:hypothetical protein